ncbi:MAG: hypothetical protein IIA77_00040 [Proteobacteria bacterium]|nr:hypothetical protein [Pseudomonadota bacterium]
MGDNTITNKKSFWEFIKPFTHWDRLWVIGQLKIVQLTIIVPILGHYIIFADKFCDLVASSKLPSISCSGGLPSDKTYWIYFALILIGISSAIFYLWCPRLVKLHGTAYKYILDESAIIKSPQMSKILYELSMKLVIQDSELTSFVRDKLEIIRGSKKIFVDHKREIVHVDALGLNESDRSFASHKNEFLFYYFENLEERICLARWIVFSLYLIGFVILAVCSAHTIKLVVNTFFN